ncbi:MAG: bifunctional oligoribonuclease/PAP phosphatase NrnA [Thermodesulfobacteriota bacterium]|nr:bifunctional oligoribonuclease/PAP phosphatase NrnA [Thermodesulfobacteriota bacterium]
MMVNHGLNEIARVIAGAENFVIAGHIFPDIDALGSQLALGNILESLGKNVLLYSEAVVPKRYNFMPGSDRLITSTLEWDSFDCAIALDCGDRFRLGKEMDNFLRIQPLVVIDHHSGHQEFGDFRWVEGDRSSTGEMVFDLAQALNGSISYDTAYCLYAAIVSDTGSFKYSSTTAETFRVAKELLEKGVKPSDVAAKLFDNFTVNRLHLLMSVLDTMEFYEDGRISVIHVTLEMFSSTGANQGDIESFINYPRSLEAVKVAVFLKESDDGLVSASLRSKGAWCDVAEVAKRFGGGGHKHAAGFKKDSTISDVRDKLLPEISLMMKK